MYHPAPSTFGLALALLLLFSGPAMTAGLGRGGVLPASPQLPPQPLLQIEGASAPEISPGEAAQRAQKINGGGKILSVVAVAGGYRVKLLKDGEVTIVFVPD